jgi:PhzF family phenazine biosynthesis protein
MPRTRIPRTRAYPFDWVDAFTTRAFGGNACMVVHDASDLPIEHRLALVRETSLSECAFLTGSDVADFGVRYYVAHQEILMAGHPTIATVTSLLARGLIDLSSGQAAFTLEVGAGVLPITVTATPDGPLVTMTQLKPEFGKRHDPAGIAALYGLDPADIVGTPQTVSTGTPFCIALLRNKDALRRATLDLDTLAQYHRERRLGPENALEPFLVTLGGETANGDTFSRLLLPPPMPAEDPFTGSATGCMAAYLWHHNLIDSPEFTAEQGHWMGRPGTAQIHVAGPRDAPDGVKVSGYGRVLMQGELHL